MAFFILQSGAESALFGTRLGQGKDHMALTVFGISNCDTVRKARKALDAEGIPYQFHDFRKDGLSKDAVARMLAVVGADVLLNKRGTTWRGLAIEDQKRADGDGLAGLLAAYPALIKRPVWQAGDDYKVGFAAKESDAILAWAKAATI